MYLNLNFLFCNIKRSYSLPKLWGSNKICHETVLKNTIFKSASSCLKMSRTVLNLWDLHSQREDSGGGAEEMCRTTSLVRKTLGCTRREVRVNFCAALDQMERSCLEGRRCWSRRTSEEVLLKGGLKFILHAYKNHEVNTQRDYQLRENRLSVCKTGIRKFRFFFRATVSINSRKLALSIN